MYRKHDINDLKYIRSLKHKRKAVVYYDDKREKYIDINSNTVASNHNIRAYEKDEVKTICNFKELLNYYSIYLLLLNSHGIRREKITGEIINDIVNIFEKIGSFNDEVSREIDYIANLISDICISNLSLGMSNNKDNEFNLVVNGLGMDISEEKEMELRDLLLNYIFIDIAMNGMTEAKLIIQKDKNFIDYKISRILKYLGININVENVPNFKIEYNLEGISYYDSKGMKTTEENLSKEEVEKIKKLVDKR